MKLFKSKVERIRDKFASDVGEFGLKHKHAFMIMADPDTNVVVAAYKGQITGFHNKSHSRRIHEMFVFDPKSEEKDGRQSKRNLAIAQFLFEVDGLIDALGKQWYNIGKGEEMLVDIQKKGIASFGSTEMVKKAAR